jgi:DNA-binding LytR/AlgR family response regulator
VARCKNALEATAILHKQSIDLVFLDIQMPGLNGLQFIQSLQRPPMIIFVTAYQEYAVEGFNLNAVDYLLKPVSFERFLRACNKAHDLFNLQQKSISTEHAPDYFFVFVEYNQVKISVNDILYVEAMKDYIKIFLSSSNRPVITRMTLKATEEKLVNHRFVRSHKSYLISTDKVSAIKRDLICIGNVELPLSENYRSEVEKKLTL